MASGQRDTDTVTDGAVTVGCIGLVVHPSRPLDASLEVLREWTRAHDADLVQVPVEGQRRQVAETGDAADCDVIVSLGGDGTMLAAIRAAVRVGRPVLGIACGSLGVLTRVPQHELVDALDRLRAGAWTERNLPALAIGRPGVPELIAFNDIAVSRAGIGQIRVTAHVNGELFGRLAGDGAVVATALGSSAYSLAAGGPLLALDAHGFVLTPLPTHGGTVPPLVLGAESRLTLDIGQGYGGARLEADGQIDDHVPQRLEIALRPDVARLVAFPDAEPLFGVLRRRGIVLDSPRILAQDRRDDRSDGSA